MGTSPLDFEQCWTAVLTKDSAADGTFVYAVKSTGVYCRPSCSSRRPRRNQVSFFAQPADAESAGFRACKRCRPKDIATPDPSVALAQHACQYIEAHLDDSLTLTDLGKALNTSPYHLQRTFKKVMGISPKQYTENCRLRQLKSGLQAGQAVTDALYDAGYSSSSRLYENAAGQLGMTPAAYRKGGRDMKIRYTIHNSPLGRLLVAGTEKGICAVSLGDTDSALESSLRKEYPAAAIAKDDTAFSDWVAVILRYLDGEQPRLDLPLDVQATAFQWRVWEALREIPYGQTNSYGEVARRIGQPTASRAVAQACATNPAALVIPCHRVKREGGELGGYRWGVDRKRALLAKEGAVAQMALELEGAE